jgi:type III restriction enzyme
MAELTDGRVLVIEYKGEHLEDKRSEQEKLDIGRLWKERSGGRAMFLWAVKQDDDGRNVRRQIEEKTGM